MFLVLACGSLIMFSGADRMKQERYVIVCVGESGKKTAKEYKALAPTSDKLEIWFSKGVIVWEPQKLA